jgi:hypothetical protein
MLVYCPGQAAARQENLALLPWYADHMHCGECCEAVGEGDSLDTRIWSLRLMQSFKRLHLCWLQSPTVHCGSKIVPHMEFRKHSADVLLEPPSCGAVPQYFKTLKPSNGPQTLMGQYINFFSRSERP